MQDAGQRQHRVLQAYRNLPMSFEANDGQTDARVKFLSRGLGYALFLTSSEAVLALHKRATADSGAAAGAVLRMKVVGANPEAELQGLDELPVKSNYFIGNDPAKWRVGVTSYAKVKYRQIYRGVDLIYYGNRRQLEYDFVVAPGADPRQIRVSIQGADEIRMDRHGDLLVAASGGEVRLHRPLVYQIRADGAGVSGDGTAGKQILEARYTLRGQRQVGIDVAAYDRKRPLIIDPVLSYSTYLGGSMEDEARGVAVDSSGNAYLAGLTRSNNFPVVEGAFQGTFIGTFDAFVTKLNASATAPLYSTYLGGNSLSFGNGIAVDNAGNAYVVGETTSRDFPVRNGFQTELRGARDAFVTKLDTNQSGSPSLVYSTYLGGANSDYGLAIAIDSTGNAYVTGKTDSRNFPTKNALQENYGGGLSDAFVTKIDTTRIGADSLIYSTYLGGGRIDEGRGIAVDSAGKAYVTGLTNSNAPAPFPTTAGALQTTFAGGQSDAFVAKIDTTRQGPPSLIYSTFLGGALQDDGNAIAIDADGNAYVTGFTSSEQFPTTAGGYRLTPPGGGDAFVSKLNATGSGLAYSTYLGGSPTVPGTGRDEGLGIAVGVRGLVYVTGSTRSRDFPTRNAFQSFHGGGEGRPLPSDAFITEFDTTRAGSASLIFSSYHGGRGDDVGRGIAVDRAGIAYFVGWTYDSTPPSFPTTPGAFQRTLGGLSDAFAAKVLPDPAPAVLLDPVRLDFGNQLIGTSSAPRVVTLTNSGTAQLNLTSIALSGINAAEFALAPTNITPCAFGASILPPGGNCTFNVVFNATTTGPKTANVEVVSNAASSPDHLPLTGTGTALSGPAVGLEPSSLGFGNQLLDTTSTAQTATLRNTGDAALAITSVTVAGANADDFAQTNTCGDTVAAGQSCNIHVTFKPTATGNRTAAVAIVNNAPGSPHQITLSGTGVAPGGPLLTLSATRLIFAGRMIGTTSGALSVGLTNSGTGSVTINRIALTGAQPSEFALSDNCPTRMAAGASCRIDVSFTPGAIGERTATVRIDHDASDAPETIELRGTGQDFALQAHNGAPTSLTVSAGETATYNLEVVPVNGFTGSVEIGCSGAPAGTSCTASPATASVTSSASVAFSVSLLRTGSAQVMLWPSDDRPQRLRFPTLAILLLSLLLLLAAIVFKRRVQLGLAPVLISLAFLVVSVGTACGNTTTAASETFTLTVTGRYQNATRPLMLTVILKH